MASAGFATAAHAEDVPGTVAFSAHLAADGIAATGSHDLVFRIYDAADAGTMLWSESSPDAAIDDGLVAHQLGSLTPFGGAVWTGAARWLEISVDGTVLEPRLVIASVPYAVRAAVASRIEGQLPASSSILESFSIRARSDCGTVAPVPQMGVYVNGDAVGEPIEVVPSTYASYEVRLAAPTYVSEIAVAFLNDSSQGECDHNLHVESITLADGTVLPADRGQSVVYDRGDFFDGVDVLAARTSLVWTGALRFLIAPRLTRTATTTYARGFADWRNNASSCAADTWCDVPQRTVTVAKRAAGSLLKITYTDTLGSYAPHYAGCNWRILVDGRAVQVFSDADATRPGGAVSWMMNHASHVAVADAVPAGDHVIKVQSRRAANTPECLMGWNENSGAPGQTGNLLVEEIP